MLSVDPGIELGLTVFCVRVRVRVRFRVRVRVRLGENPNVSDPGIELGDGCL